MCACVCARVCACAGVCRCLWRAEESIKCPRAGAWGSHEQPERGSGEHWPSARAARALNREPPFPPVRFFF